MDGVFMGPGLRKVGNGGTSEPPAGRIQPLRACMLLESTRSEQNVELLREILERIQAAESLES